MAIVKIMTPHPVCLLYYFDCTVLQVTMLQLEKTYGRNKDAKNFIQELVKGVLSINLPLYSKKNFRDPKVINHESFPFSM